MAKKRKIRGITIRDRDGLGFLRLAAPAGNLYVEIEGESHITKHVFVCRSDIPRAIRKMQEVWDAGGK